DTTFMGLAGFNGFHVNAGSIFNKAQFMGEANFGHFRSGMTAEFANAKFSKRANFNSARIDGHLISRNANFIEECSLSLAEINGNIEFQDATFEGALILSGTTAGGVVFINNCKVRGNFQCISSNFKKNVYCESSEFSDETDFSGSHIFGALFLREATFGGRVRFRSTALNVVSFSESDSETPSTQFKGAIDLRGCTYNQIHPLSIWKQLLGRLEPYDRQPYVQFEQTVRNSGHDQLANDIYYDRKQKESGLLGFREQRAAWTINYLHWLLTGYGVRLRRLLPLLIAIVVAGTLFFHTFDNSLKIEDSNNSAIAESPTWNDAFLVTLNHFIPVVDIPVGAKWQPTGWYRLFALSLTLSGWILVPVSIAGLTGFLKR
ncbi:MAG: pentapeptide repeat-containing protein, partial [Chloroflexi bacterium]|nr:pentapeptide repeat-containing protein [Chloroflexota bacterium]